MYTDAVIGCDAVDVGPEWLRLKTQTGVVRTIPWGAIRIAGMGGNHDRQVAIAGVTDRTQRFYKTHDSLWVVYADGGFAQVMIEKSGPKRAEILAAFPQQLPAGWRGDKFKATDLSKALMNTTLRAAKLPTLVTIMIVAMTAMILLAIVVGYLGNHRPQ
jgi:hypothetical protein